MPTNSIKRELLIEAEIIPGIKDLALIELGKLKDEITIFQTASEDRIVFTYRGELTKLKNFRKISAFYLLLCFPIKGPGSLLKSGLLAEVAINMQLAAKNSLDYQPHSFRLSAAGDTSGTYQTIIDKLTHLTGMVYSKDNGDMLLRIRPAASSKSVWEVLIRLSARPLSTKTWRVENFPGALNSILAASLYDLSQPKKGDALINVMSGSGTLLIEAAERKKLSRIVGVEIDSKVLEMSRRNIRAANVKGIELFCADATMLDFADNSFDIALADLPWGERIGSRSNNDELYNKTLLELSRVIKVKGKIGLLTQDTESLKVPDSLKLIHQRKVFQGGFHPTIYIFENQK